MKINFKVAREKEFKKNNYNNEEIERKRKYDKKLEHRYRDAIWFIAGLAYYKEKNI